MSKISILSLNFILITLGLSVAHASPLVNKGDTLIFSSDVFGDQEAVKTVEWSQSFSKRTAKYIQVTASVKSATPTLTMVFIAKPLAIALKESNCKGMKCTLKVDDRFQYGQNSEKTMRFLVLHDKSNKPYQHRFISTSTLSTFADGAKALANQADKVGAIIPPASIAAATGKQAISAIKALVGDPLRDF